MLFLKVLLESRLPLDPRLAISHRTYERWGCVVPLLTVARTRRRITERSFATIDLAYVGPVSSVGIKVRVESRPLRECLGTVFTFEWLLIYMDDFMTVSVTLARERPLADGTTMRHSVRVDRVGDVMKLRLLN